MTLLRWECKITLGWRSTLREDELALSLPHPSYSHLKLTLIIRILLSFGRPTSGSLWFNLWIWCSLSHSTSLALVGFGTTYFQMIFMLNWFAYFKIIFMLIWSSKSLKVWYSICCLITMQFSKIERQIENDKQIQKRSKICF